MGKAAYGRTSEGTASWKVWVMLCSCGTTPHSQEAFRWEMSWYLRLTLKSAERKSTDSPTQKLMDRANVAKCWQQGKGITVLISYCFHLFCGLESFSLSLGEGCHSWQLKKKTYKYPNNRVRAVLFLYPITAFWCFLQWSYTFLKNYTSHYKWGLSFQFLSVFSLRLETCLFSFNFLACHPV